MLTPNSPAIRILALAAFAGVASFASAESVSLTAAADAGVRYGTGQSSNYGSSTNLYLYANGTAQDYFAYVRFDLSTLPDDIVITDISLSLTKVPGVGRDDQLTNARFRVFGLDDVAGNTAQNWDEVGLTFDTIGAEWTAANSFDLSRVTSFDGTAGNETIGSTVTYGGSSLASISGTALADFVSGKLGANFVTFIVDQGSGSDPGRGFSFASRENAVSDPASVPTLVVTYAAVPEPGTAGLVALGLGALLWRRRRA